MNTTNTIDKIDSIENQKNYIVKLVQRFFNADGVGYYCGKGEKQCSDCSVLYTIGKNNTGKISLIKVGIGEFNCNTFLEVKGFKDSPVPLFVINSSDSYFTENNIKEFRDNNPIEYLNNYAILASSIPGSKAIFRRQTTIGHSKISRGKILRNTPIPDYSIYTRDKIQKLFEDALEQAGNGGIIERLKKVYKIDLVKALSQTS